MLPINRWESPYERVFLGGLTCDSDDYYNSEQHLNAIYLPKFKASDDLYIGFFNTAAYQDNIGGHGGVHHCLIPGPKHVLINQDAEGELNYEVFAEEQNAHQMLSLLGYDMAGAPPPPEPTSVEEDDMIVPRAQQNQEVPSVRKPGNSTSRQ